MTNKKHPFAIEVYEFKPLEMTSMQISVYALNCPKEDKYFEEVADLIERYADTKVYKELEEQSPSPWIRFEDKKPEINQEIWIVWESGNYTPEYRLFRAWDIQTNWDGIRWMPVPNYRNI